MVRVKPMRVVLRKWLHGNASAFAFEILAKLQIEETAKASSQQSTLPLLLPKSAQIMSSDSTPPKVFISYSHDSQEHKDRILATCRSLSRRMALTVILTNMKIRR
jgi:hypothetical protein